MIDHIFYYFASCSILSTLTYGFKLITDHKTKIYKLYALCIPFFAIIMTFENYYHLDTLNTITSFCFYFILYFLIYRRNRKETTYYGIVLWSFGLIIDILAMICSKFIPYLSLLMIRSIYTIFLDIILIFILRNKKLHRWFKSLYKKISRVKFPYFRLILLITILCSLGYALYFSVVEKNIVNSNISLYVLLISVLILIIIYINCEYNNYSLKETNDHLIKSNEFYITIVDDYHILKHNIIHQLNGIKSVSNKKSIQLIEDLIKSYNENNKCSHKMQKLPIGISRIVYEKIYDCNEPNLKLGVDNIIETNVFDHLSPRRYNLLCEALGVLLDNALQATLKTKDKIIMIDMRETENSYRIKIINTFSELLDIDKLGTMKYTTKKSGHGIGLFSIIGRKKVKVKTSIINDLFINEIIINKKLD